MEVYSMKEFDYVGLINQYNNYQELYGEDPRFVALSCEQFNLYAEALDVNVRFAGDKDNPSKATPVLEYMFKALPVHVVPDKDKHLMKNIRYGIMVK